MILLWIFWAFFISNMLGYGGGPSVIPLIKHEVVNHFDWLSSEKFAEVLAIGNMLPGPIATKMAGYIGYELGGAAGALVALAATVAPSLLLMIFLLQWILKHKQSPRVQNMTTLVKPAIAAMLVVIAWEFLRSAQTAMGWTETAVMAVAAWLLMEKANISPFFVIVAALIYGFCFV